METLAFLHLAQENEESEAKAVTLDVNKLSGKAAIGALGIAAAAVGAFGLADNASAQSCGGYYPVYDGCGGGYGYYPYDSGYNYYPSYYNYGYDYYNYYPASYYNYDPYYSSCGGGYQVYDPCGGYNNYYPDYSYYPSNYYNSYSSCGGGYQVYDPCGGGGYLGVGPWDGPGARPGDVGYDVVAVQRALNANGFPVAVDGVAGPQTTSAIAAFQASRGILVDGIAGPQTLSFLGLY